MKKTLSALLVQKDLNKIPQIEYSGSLKEALFKLEETDTGTLLVMNGFSIVGIFSERDFARASAYCGSPLSMEIKVTELMSREIVYVTPDYTLEECMAVMCKLRIRHLPVLRDNRPIALLSMRHLMEAIVEENEFMIGQLVSYITGSPTGTGVTHRGALIID